MEYRHLGRWGVRISAVGLGSWLTYGGTVEAKAAADCIRRAYERGVTFFDTANGYSGGHAEEVMGQALSGYERSSYVLATKVYFPQGDGPNDRGLSRKHIRDQVHRSLARLGVDHIDLYQCHRFDRATPVDETCRMMDDLIRAGKILYWGVSEWTGEQIRTAVELCREQGWSEPVSNQPQYSALYRRIEADVLPTSAELGLGTVVWSPLAMGILTGKYRSVADIPPGSRAASPEAGFMADYFRQDVLDAVAQLAPLAADAGCTVAQLALAWCLRHDAVSSVIVGASNPDQVDDNVAAADLSVAPNIFDEMDRVLEPVALGVRAAASSPA